MTTSRPDLFRYRGRSMWPCFQDGDLLELAPVGFDQIRRGDCIAYRDLNGRLAVHRVIRTGRRLTTRGDAMPTADLSPVSDGQVLGRVVRRYRLGRVSWVRGGMIGRIAGGLLHYAGRIDPYRDSHGGRLANIIRRMMSGILKGLGMSGRMERLVRHGEPDMVVWKFCGVVVGRQEPATAVWSLAWPWSVLLDP